MNPETSGSASSPISGEDLSYVRSLYLDRIAQHGVTLESMKSGGEAKQRMRHRVHGELVGPHDNVLDVGSGIGQFRDHLEKAGFKGAYHGIDLIPDYVEHCRARFPDSTFELRDVFASDIQGEYDVIVASQVFNVRYKQSDNQQVLQRFLTMAFAKCRKAVTVDLITSYVDFSVPDLYNFAPEEIFHFAKTLTPFVRLRHDYLPFEFSVQLFKSSLDPRRVDLPPIRH
jgi:SAM-dependent methyltransferase